MASRDHAQTTTDGQGALPLPTLNSESCDALLSATLRASLWLDETGHALRLQGSGEVADNLIREGGFARAAALQFMLDQHEEHAAIGDGAGHGTASTLGNSGMPEPSSPNLGDPDQ